MARFQIRFLLVWLLVFSLVPLAALAETRYVSNCVELQEIKDHLDADVIVTQDIDCSDTKNWNGGAGFEPIGDNDTPFVGTFSAMNYTVYNLTIYRPITTYVGLFGYVSGSSTEITNIGLEKVYIIGFSRVGGLVGYQYGTTITQSYVTGDVLGNNQVGGLVGHCRGTIIESYATGNVLGGSQVGGLVGHQEYSTFIIQSYATGHVSGSSAIGGLVGHQSSSQYYYASITQSYAAGAVSGESYLGGLVGYQEGYRSSITQSYALGDVSGSYRVGGLTGTTTDASISQSYASGNILSLGETAGGLTGVLSYGGEITQSYASGNVSGIDYIGGLAGYLEAVSIYRPTITRSYATGHVSGSSYVGGFVGFAIHGFASHNYWDIATSSQTRGIGATGKTTQEMYQQATFVDWDFNNIWEIDEGHDYPKLQALAVPIILLSPIADQSVGVNEPFALYFLQEMFYDPSDPELEYTVQLSSGAPLPAWLTFSEGLLCFPQGDYCLLGTPRSGDQGSFSIEVTATNNQDDSASDIFVLTVTNQDPIQNRPLSDDATDVGVFWTYTFAADTFFDPDGDALSYTALFNSGPLPVWLTFTSSTRTIEGTPISGAQGVHTISIIASDNFGGSAQGDFSLTVRNRAPMLQNPVDPLEAFNGELFEWAVPSETFSDGDGDMLAYNITRVGGAPLPDWLTFEEGTALLSGTPTQRATEALELTASDGFGGQANTALTLTVPNTPPSIVAPLPNQAAELHEAFNFDVPANTFEDIDDDTLSYTAFLFGDAPLPDWMQFDASTQTFSGIAEERNTYTIVVAVDDGAGGQASTSFEFRVANQAPQLNQTLTNHTVWVSEQWVFSFDQNLFVDPDGDALIYSATQPNSAPLPVWLVFNATTRTFIGTPPSGVQGIVALVIFAEDGFGGQCSVMFYLIIPNRAPELVTPIDEQRFHAEQAFVWPLPNGTFIDPDDDPLHYTAQQPGGAPLPSGITIDANTGALSGTLSAEQMPFTIEITAEDIFGEQASTSFDVAINHLPVVEGFIDSQQATVDNPFLYTFPPTLFTDPDGDVLRYEAKENNADVLPAWLTLNSDTRTFIGTPALADQGFLFVELFAVDPYDGRASTVFGIAISDLSGNQPPYVAVTIPTQTAYSSTSFLFTFDEGTFEDPDGDVLTYTASLEGGAPLPPWLFFDPDARQFSGVPPNIGSLRISVRAADDNGGLALNTFSLLIEDATNHPPEVFNPLTNQKASVGEPFLLPIPADTFRDPNGDALIYTALKENGSPLPGWLTFDPATRTFSGKPGWRDTGIFQSDRVHTIELRASDGEGSATLQFKLAVTGKSLYDELFEAAKIIVPIASVLLSIYLARAKLWNFFMKRHYRKGTVFAYVDEPFSLPAGLDNKDYKWTKAYKYGEELRSGNKLPEWLKEVERAPSVTSKSAAKPNSLLGIAGTPTAADIDRCTLRVYRRSDRIAKEVELIVCQRGEAETEYDPYSDPDTVTGWRAWLAGWTWSNKNPGAVWRQMRTLVHRQRGGTAMAPLIDPTAAGDTNTTVSSDEKGGNAA